MCSECSGSQRSNYQSDQLYSHLDFYVMASFFPHLLKKCVFFVGGGGNLLWFGVLFFLIREILKLNVILWCLLMSLYSINCRLLQKVSQS